MRHAHRQAIDRDFGHEAIGNGFENDRRPVEPELARQILELRHVAAPVARHGPMPGVPACDSARDSVAKKFRSAIGTSSGPLIEWAPHGRPASATAWNSCEISLGGL